MRKLLLSSVICSAATVLAEVPKTCITDTSEDFTGVARGTTVEVNDAVADTADPTTRFFGLRSCTENESGRMVSIQFFLRKDGQAELEAMPQVGPTLPDDLVTCVRRKLERDDYYIDKVTIWESAGGVDAFEFKVGALSERFGTPLRGSTKSEVRFTRDS